jgi:anti-anti-sigma factor
MTVQTAPITITQQGDVHVVEFTTTRLSDDSVVMLVKEALDPLIQAEVKLVLDFTPIQHVSSTMLGLLINLNSGIKRVNGQLRLVGFGPELKATFEITQLHKLFRIFPDRDSGLKSFA